MSLQSKKGLQERTLHSKRAQSSQPVESALTLPVPNSVQFIIQVNTEVLIRVHNLNNSQYVHRYQSGGSVPAKIHHQVLGCTPVHQEVFLLAPLHEVLCPLSIL
ncbi:hypothetical protein ATANTOWER_008061 [Ataeniobius toweri]|uniref:Uncharacterized protein n=1 Tax=Ataeniobius toweri TaxID=208326 RepID=A0ABU7CFV8_9TELE|nr:hypothetical protein [Ataeniobius toweri]